MSSETSDQSGFISCPASRGLSPLSMLALCKTISKGVGVGVLYMQNRSKSWLDPAEGRRPGFVLMWWVDVALVRTCWAQERPPASSLTPMMTKPTQCMVASNPLQPLEIPLTFSLTLLRSSWQTAQWKTSSSDHTLIYCSAVPGYMKSSLWFD